MLKHRIATLALGVVAFVAASAGSAQSTVIIWTNTVWSSGSIHTLSDTVQIAPGAILTIAPGAIVNGNGWSIETAGKLKIGKVGGSVAVLRYLTINYVKAQGSTVIPQIDIENVDWDLGSLLSNYMAGGSMNLRSSYVRNLSYSFIGPGDVVTMERNLFELLRTMDSYSQLSLINNTFSNHVDSQTPDVQVNDRGSSVEVIGNNFVESQAPALETPIAASGAAFTAQQNWFGSANRAYVASRILDYSDDLTRAKINYIPYLTTPSATAPIYLDKATATFAGGDTPNFVHANAVNTQLAGGPANDILIGGKGNDMIAGNAGADRIIGGAGNDTIDGGAGRDTLSGEAGRDTFVFSAPGDTPVGITKADLVLDFEDASDIVDVSKIDGDAAVPMTFLGRKLFTGHPGEVRYFTRVVAEPNRTLTRIQGDLNGDRIPDFEIDLLGVHTLKASNFKL